jgi:hypothetical protein
MNIGPPRHPVTSANVFDLKPAWSQEALEGLRNIVRRAGLFCLFTSLDLLCGRRRHGKGDPPCRRMNAPKSNVLK